MRQSLSDRILFGMWPAPLAILVGVPLLWLIFEIVENLTR